LCENFEEHLKIIVKNSDNYIKIYDELKIIFDVSNVEIWEYNATTKILLLLASTPIEMVAELGITQEVLATKNPIFTNHVVSEKNYNMQVDNINAYKIKSMLIAPIVNNGDIVGVIRLYRKIDNKINFSSKDVSDIKQVMPILSKLVLKIDNNQASEEKKFEIEKKELQEEIKKYKSYMEASKESIKVLTNKLNLHETKNIELQKKIVTLETDKSKLSTKFAELQRSYDFLEKVASSKDEYSKMDTILSKIYASQNDNENLMTLLEFAVFVDDFKQIPKSVEEALKSSKIVSHALDLCSFIHDEKKDKKYAIEAFVKKIQLNSQTILQERNTKLKVFIQKDTPKSLVFHAEAVESIMSRAIVRAQNFLHTDNIINLKVSFKEKQLYIELNFNIEKEKKMMKLFHGNKDIFNDKNDLFTKFNNKLLKSMSGEIYTKHEEGHYSFMLKVPAVIIKL